VILVGNPNVGKSALFAALTGHYVAVSNYPGTTVEIARGTLSFNGDRRPVIDTPGIRSVVPLSDDERVARDILLDDGSATVIEVADAKNLRRGLLLGLELADAGIPLVLALNMADEAEARGIRVDGERLGDLLGVPVVATVATRRTGVRELVKQLPEARPAAVGTTLDPPIEEAIARVEALLPRTALRPRSLALMLLSGDEGLATELDLGEEARAKIDDARREAERRVGEPLAYSVTRRRLEAADSIMKEVVRTTPARRSAAEAIGRAAAHPLLGWPILLVVLGLVYLLVGRFGAGTLVNLLEKRLFGGVVNPWARRVASDLIPIDLIRHFLVGPYGLITMAITYGLSIILPVVAMFFLAFGALEDSGYLPRLAVMLDRAFRRMGLNGRAVLPMILGLGCVTMATMTTRILETRKERLQVTLLLALSIPCSAQLGVILGLISGTGAVGVAIWGGIVLSSLLCVGYLAARVIPGQPSDFVLELPPMRVPSARNIAVKTVARMEWYLKEVIPLFVIATAALFVLDETGLLAVLERALSPVVVHWLGLPAAVTGVLLLGFLRRDYGAAGLFALAGAGALAPSQVLVALVVITLFIPCVASILIIAREYGRKVAAAVVAFVFPFAFLVGGLLHVALEALHVQVG
jgi:ferrous iron transport protein B